MCSHRFDLKCEEEKIMNEKANYGNWVPEKALYMLFGAAVLLGVIAVLAQTVLDKPVVTAVSGVLCVVALVMAVYMLICHETFAFGKGNMMAGVHEHLVEHLDWNGEGRLLDIGCGAAALTVRCAKAFPKAQITAMDYWGAEWNYAKEQCEKNAQIEGVADRTSFQKGDAAKLDFPDESFDAAVSNFVFHEVRTAKDKRDVVREALRIVKKGGVFSFQDMFSQKALYGDMEQFVRELKAEGISEVHYIGNLEKKLDFIPGFVTTPWMISGMGIIYGKK
jgi:ubiquinone/menaquinone biosynthesis C-methylase UbiE